MEKFVKEKPVLPPTDYQDALPHSIYFLPTLYITHAVAHTLPPLVLLCILTDS